MVDDDTGLEGDGEVVVVVAVVIERERLGLSESSHHQCVHQSIKSIMHLDNENVSSLWR